VDETSKDLSNIMKSSPKNNVIQRQGIHEMLIHPCSTKKCQRWQEEDKKEAAAELLKYRSTFVEVWLKALGFHDATPALLEEVLGEENCVHSDPCLYLFSG
jgi:hypothetical protein